MNTNFLAIETDLQNNGNGIYSILQPTPTLPTTLLALRSDAQAFLPPGSIPQTDQSVYASTCVPGFNFPTTSTTDHLSAQSTCERIGGAGTTTFTNILSGVISAVWESGAQYDDNLLFLESFNYDFSSMRTASTWFNCSGQYLPSNATTPFNTLFYGGTSTVPCSGTATCGPVSVPTVAWSVTNGNLVAAVTDPGSSTLTVQGINGSCSEAVVSLSLVAIPPSLGQSDLQFYPSQTFQDGLSIQTILWDDGVVDLSYNTPGLTPTTPATPALVYSRYVGFQPTDINVNDNYAFYWGSKPINWSNADTDLTNTGYYQWSPSDLVTYSQHYQYLFHWNTTTRQFTVMRVNAALLLKQALSGSIINPFTKQSMSVVVRFYGNSNLAIFSTSNTGGGGTSTSGGTPAPAPLWQTNTPDGVDPNEDFITVTEAMLTAGPVYSPNFKYELKTSGASTGSPYLIVPNAIVANSDLGAFCNSGSNLNSCLTVYKTYCSGITPSGQPLSPADPSCTCINGAAFAVAALPGAPQSLIQSIESAIGAPCIPTACVNNYQIYPGSFISGYVAPGGCSPIELCYTGTVNSAIETQITINCTSGAPCTVATECNLGFACDPTTKTCQPPCSATVPCPTGQTCGSDGFCTGGGPPPTCTATSCPKGKVCDSITGQCITKPSDHKWWYIIIAVAVVLVVIVLIALAARRRR